MILLKHYSLLLLFICASLGLAAQLSPQTAVAEMGRGINLGNTLEPPLEGAWNNGPAQESYFDAYLAAGFKNIRIPVRWDQHTGNAAPFTIDSTWMNRVEQVVDWGLSRGFYITLNGHHEDWLKNNYSNPTLRARYDSIWVQVAERFKNKSDSLLFEIINEPIGMTVAEVDDLNQRILGIIRQTNPTRIVIYSGNRWSNSAELLNAAIPNDNYIIGYYHAYDPWQFS
ncbi:MAG: glycoside hydrolase family 5 protein, partial [Bacteroidota bacterium]